MMIFGSLRASEQLFVRTKPTRFLDFMEFLLLRLLSSRELLGDINYSATAAHPTFEGNKFLVFP